MAQDSAASGTRAPDEPSELRRSLRVRDLVVYGLLFIAPMAPVGVFGVLDAKSHGAVGLVYVVATIAMGFTAVSYAQMVKVVPRAGAVFAYARVGLGESAGFIAGWMALLDYLLIPAVAYVFSGIALNSLVPSVNQWIWTVLAVVVTTGLNLAGVRVAALAGMLVLIMEIAVLLVFIAAAIVALAQHGAARPLDSPFTGIGGFDFAAVLSAVSVAVLSFLGFDAIASFAEEHAGPARGVARAVIFCLVLAGVLFIAQTYLAEVLTPHSPAFFAAHPDQQGPAFYSTAESAVGGWLHTTVAVSKAIGAAFAALAGQAAAGRLLFAMGRERRLPRALAATGSGVPRRALIVAAVITLLAAIWGAEAGNGLDHLTSAVDVGALTAFVLLHASVIGWHTVKHHSRAWLPHLVVPVLGIAIIAAVLYEASSTALYVGAAWLLIGLATLAVRRARA